MFAHAMYMLSGVYLEQQWYFTVDSIKHVCKNTLPVASSISTGMLRLLCFGSCKFACSVKWVTSVKKTYYKSSSWQVKPMLYCDLPRCGTFFPGIHVPVWPSHWPLQNWRNMAGVNQGCCLWPLQVRHYRELLHFAKPTASRDCRKCKSIVLSLQLLWQAVCLERRNA